MYMECLAPGNGEENEENEQRRRKMADLALHDKFHQW